MTEKKKDDAVATNRKARHEYFIEDTVEAGMALLGTEVKSLRLGHANLTDSYAIVKNNVNPIEKVERLTAIDRVVITCNTNA